MITIVPFWDKHDFSRTTQIFLPLLMSLFNIPVLPLEYCSSGSGGGGGGGGGSGGSSSSSKNSLYPAP